MVRTIGGAMDLSGSTSSSPRFKDPGVPSTRARGPASPWATGADAVADTTSRSSSSSRSTSAGPIKVRARRRPSAHPVLRTQAGGRSTVSLEGATVGEVLQALVSAHPGISEQVLNEDGSLHQFVNVYVNDDDVRYLPQLDTPVTEGDEITILPAVAGG